VSVVALCTLCGGPRDFNGRDFAQHVATEQHQRAVAEWDGTHDRRHHDGHVALKIDCQCVPKSEAAR
jgi:hypothetical protein